MKKTFTFILLLLLAANWHCFAVSYSITFTGSGASTTVSSVQVLNLTSNVNVSVPAGNALFLTDDAGQTAPAGSIKMIYATGNRLLYTGISGNYKTVVPDIPTAGKAIDFYFVACTDGSGNNYKVVTIGTQIWMAEDLRTTKFNDGTSIYQAPDDDVSWATLTTPAYCTDKWVSTWGHYYNGYAASTANLAPAGWRVATNADWNTLNGYTTNNSTYGPQAKALTDASTTWNSHTNVDVPGNDVTKNNSTGFSAFPTGWHPLDGVTADLHHSGNWWTSSNTVWTMWNDYKFLYQQGADRAAGFTVRCVLNGVVNRVSVTSPAYCSNIQGNTTINISALGFTSVTVTSWHQGTGFGSNSTIGTVTLNGGNGSIVFPADQYPHGPITLKISGTNSSTTDNCYLQLYNNGGVSWNEGMPAAPSQTQGMSLAFSDDFTSMSIGGDGSGATYYDHKPPHGNEDFSSIPFTSYSAATNPFSQTGSYLRIRANANTNSAGLISSMFSDKSGFKALAPCYFECRFIAPNAPGTWPAFWIINAKDDINNYNEPNDELDIIEAYGGEGPGEPNSGFNYGIAAHAWGQTGSPVDIANQFYASYFPANMNNHGIPSTWYESPHTYGCMVGLDYTVYYCDNIEVGRHQTLPVSKVKPFYFMINLATGGGWPVDLARYNGLGDMYVDYVRVYTGVAVNTPVTGVTVSPTASTINVGGTQQLTATVAPSNATNKTVTWSSGNTAVATVSTSGLVTGVAAGTAVITSNTQDGGKTATSSVTVTATTIPVTGVSASPATATVNVGGTQQLTATVAPSNATNKTVTWTSGNTAVATVSTSGLVTGVSAGTATITITTQDGAKTAASVITVSATTIPVTGVSVTPLTAAINVGGTQQLTATVAPSNATNQTISWSSGNTGIATVSTSGLVTGVASGSATITATTQDGGKTAVSTVTINGSCPKLTGTVTGTSGSYNNGPWTIVNAFDGDISTYVDNMTANAWAGLDLGGAHQITSIRYYPRNGWTSRMTGGIFQGSGVADFSSGVVNLYTVTTEPTLSWNQVPVTNTNSFRYVRYLSPATGYLNVAEIEFYSCITTNIPVTGIAVSPASISIAPGGTTQLTASVSPSNATNPSVSWSSANTAVATVSTSGLITGIASGSATITATTQDGAKTAACSVTVTGSSPKLTGSVTGTPGSYNNGPWTIDKAFDGDTSTYVDNLTTGAWAGLDLATGHQITSIKYFPRIGWTSRMVGGKFQGSGTGDFSSGVVDLYTVTSEPTTSWSEVIISNPSSFRYVRYLTPDFGYCNIAEIEFYGFAKSSVKGISTTMNDASSAEIVVYPNPASSVINISGDIHDVRLYSLLSRQILLVSHSNVLDVSFLSKGMYIVIVTDIHGNQKSTKLEIL